MKNILSTFVAALIASLVTLAAYHYFVDNKQTIQVEPTAQTAFATYLEDARPAASAAAVPFDFTTAAAKVTPAVVHITSTQGVVAQNGEEDERMQQIPEFFRDFFGDSFRGMPQQRGPRMGSGSGVIISSDGYIVTNNHVVADADELAVVLTDNRSYTAKVIGTDPTTDIALIKIDEENLPALTLANSDNVKVGEWVMAAGNPLMGLNSTVTAGIVSATGRDINILRRQDQYAIESFIQTDAAVNPGNSGGALTNVDGDLIGINTAIMSPTGSYAGYSFAVPSNIVKKVVEDLKEYGKVQRALIGVSIMDVNAATAERFDLDVTRGVYVDSVMADGAGAAAGLKEGDIIIRIDEKNTNKSADLQSYVGRKRPGDKVDVTVMRGGDEKTLSLTLKGMEGSEMITSRERSSELETLGAQFKELNEEELNELGLDYGVQVVRTYPGKLRQQGVRPGFVITRVANKPIKSLDDLSNVAKGESGGVLIEGIYPELPNETQFYGVGL